MPALMKEWCDVVLQEGWAYGGAGSAGGAVSGKGYWLVATTGGAAAEFAAGARHGRPFADYLAPFEQTAALCGMDWIAPHILHAAHDVDAGTVDAHVAGFSARLQKLAGAPAPPLNLGHHPGATDGT
jgi:glutathione-regulated potassium-efflux system ancillary protein KefF